MTEDFALIDFALSARPPAEVAEAIGRVRSGRTNDVAKDAPGGRRTGFLSRLFHRRGSSSGAQPRGTPLLIQPDGTLGPAPMTRIVLTDMGYGAADSPVRISAPIGVGGLTLIEFREGDGEVSFLCQGLSEVLFGDEVFYFRYSGSRHPGAHYAFHVYQGGRVTRRAISMSVQGTAPEADWGGMDAGMPHPLETDSLPAPGTPNSEIMTPVRQAAILEALGVDPEALFVAPPEDMISLELSDAPGGLPLSEAQSEIVRKRHIAGDWAAPGSMESDAPAAELAEEPHDAPALSPAPQLPATVEDPATALSGPMAPGAHPWEAQSTAPSWEEEVTMLLVAAVETALPAEEQVEWLDDLTAGLEAGEIDAALAEAHRMIAAGQRSDQEKNAAARRLSELFGRG